MRKIQELLENRGGSYILPFLWMKGEDEETIRREIGKIAECGIREICLESRPHPDFAGPAWWESLDVVIEEAKRRNMRLWILDDRKFPTGFANGGFARHPELAKTYLAERHMDMVGPRRNASVLISPFLGKDGKLLRVLAFRRPDGNSTDLDPDSCMDLTDAVDHGFVRLDIPEGRWRLLVVYTTQTGSGRPQYANLLDAESVRVLIDEVYEKHYAHYGAEFGKTIAGFFSDEPEIGNMGGYDFHELPGREGRMLPWSRGLEERLHAAWEDDFAGNLAALWFQAGPQTPEIRHCFMDAVTDLVYTCFSGQLGAWCRDHGVEYIGHIIEDDNAHGRLGCSIGHYFKEMRGQQMAGIDVVHFQIVPGFEDRVHQWLSWNTDGSFFHYGLTRLAVSAAQIDPDKQGRSLCEIFGNYGWAFGVSRMKWLTNHMLVRGINHFTPHAFSMQFPDPDCPPHFYAGGNNPQFPHFAALMIYMNRMCHLLNGGCRRIQAAVLYHAEAEWGGCDAMTFDVPGRQLMEHQLDYDVIPEDFLTLSQTTLENGLLKIGRGVYPCVVQPYFERIPDRLAMALGSAAEAGVPVLVVDGLPESLMSGKPLPESYLDGVRVVKLQFLAEEVGRLVPADFTLRTDCGPDPVRLPHLRSCVYEQGDARFFMFFNEDVNAGCSFRFTPAGSPAAVYEYDAMNNRLCEWEAGGAGIALELEPGEARVFMVPCGAKPDTFAAGTGCAKPASARDGGIQAAASRTERKPARPLSRYAATPLLTQWRISLKAPKEADFTPAGLSVSGNDLPNMNAPAYFPEFSGTYRYEGSFVFSSEAEAKQVTLFFAEIGDCARVYLNGKEAGLLMGSRERLDVTNLICEGENRITVDVTNTLVWQVKDPVSTQIQLDPTGMTVAPVLERWH